MTFRRNKKIILLAAIITLLFFNAPKVFLKNITARAVLFFAPESEGLRTSRQDLALLLRIADLERENGLLKNSLGLRAPRSLPAKVIFGGGYFFMDAVFVNIGNDAGVEPGDPVISEGGVLVGRVSESLNGRSKVLLSGRIGEEAALRLGKEPGSPVEARGRGGGEFVAELPAGADVKVGDAARFSDLPDYIAGLVDKIAVEEGSQLKKVFIRTPFYPGELYEVRVILKK
ncbi:MAG: hypothetical protein HYW15_02560 [Candidatus Giovannonibacteria bacterium]|nr:MAG: hypothetical protein HYW15_02560 [Candidatus Giovannonibacteria bacterium]